jgi:hypothetical protein
MPAPKRCDGAMQAYEAARDAGFYRWSVGPERKFGGAFGIPDLNDCKLIAFSSHGHGIPIALNAPAVEQIVGRSINHIQMNRRTPCPQ